MFLWLIIYLSAVITSFGDALYFIESSSIVWAFVEWDIPKFCSIYEEMTEWNIYQQLEQM